MVSVIKKSVVVGSKTADDAVVATQNRQYIQVDDLDRQRVPLTESCVAIRDPGGTAAISATSSAHARKGGSDSVPIAQPKSGQHEQVSSHRPCRQVSSKWSARASKATM